MLPILYKLFSRVLFSRIREQLDRAQSVDQAGFRSGFSCEDNLHAIVLLIEASLEYNTAVWACAVDFRKAFDTVEHGAVFEALASQDVDKRYIKVLADLYSGQVGFIKGRSLSKGFQISRGTKQGDPLSPALSNALLERIMRELKAKWQHKRWGIELAENPSEMLTNL
eukprot:9634425-Karenia_brevis.AAC.1